MLKSLCPFDTVSSQKWVWLRQAISSAIGSRCFNVHALLSIAISISNISSSHQKSTSSCWFFLMWRNMQLSSFPSGRLIQTSFRTFAPSSLLSLNRGHGWSRGKARYDGVQHRHRLKSISDKGRECHASSWTCAPGAPAAARILLNSSSKSLCYFPKTSSMILNILWKNFLSVHIHTFQELCPSKFSVPWEGC